VTRYIYCCAACCYAECCYADAQAHDKDLGRKVLGNHRTHDQMLLQPQTFAVVAIIQNCLKQVIYMHLFSMMYRCMDMCICVFIHVFMNACVV
jgi:hypothetical protein